MDLRDKIEAAALNVFGGAVKKQSRELADAILAIPEIAEALVAYARQGRPNDPNSVQGIDHWSGH